MLQVHEVYLLAVSGVLFIIAAIFAAAYLAKCGVNQDTFYQIEGND
jgi:hypothetical protein